MKTISFFHVDAVLLPHFSAVSQSLSAILRPTSSALVMNLHARAWTSLPRIFVIMASRMLLRILSTHFSVRSMMDRSIFDRILNHIFSLRALVLTWSKSCFAITRGPSSLSLRPSKRHGTKVPIIIKGDSSLVLKLSCIVLYKRISVQFAS